MPSKRHISESSDESSSEYQDEPLFVPKAMLASRASGSGAAAAPAAGTNRGMNGVGNGNGAIQSKSSKNNNVEVRGGARSGGGGGGGRGNGGGDGAPTGRPANMVETYDDVQAQIERHVKNTTRLMIDASATVKINIGIGGTTKEFVVFREALVPHSKFFRSFFAHKHSNISVGPVNGNPAPANNAQALSREEKRAVQASALAPAPVQSSPNEIMILSEAMIITRTRQLHPNRSGQAPLNSDLNVPPLTGTMKSEPIEILTPSPDLAPARPPSGPTIVVNISPQVALLQTITPTQFTCFLSWLYTGKITKDSIGDCTSHLVSSKPSLESLWFLGLKLQCPSFQNRVIQGILATREMHEGEWPSPSKVKFIEDKLSSLSPTDTPEQSVLRNLAVTCIAINTPFQKCEEGSPTAKAWDKLFDEKSAVVKEALKLKTEKWTNAKPWHKIYLKLWLVPEVAGLRTV